jgi:hypothetical protein
VQKDEVDEDPTVASEIDSNHDMYEAIQMKKINQKFSKLMSFDLEKTFNKTQSLMNRHQQLSTTVNNMNAFDNMRLNQSRFKASGPNTSVMKFANFAAATATGGGTIKGKRAPLKTSQKPFRVRFSLDKEDDDM